MERDEMDCDFSGNEEENEEVNKESEWESE